MLCSAVGVFRHASRSGPDSGRSGHVDRTRGMLRSVILAEISSSSLGYGPATSFLNRPSQL